VFFHEAVVEIINFVGGIGDAEEGEDGFVQVGLVDAAFKSCLV